MSIGYHLPVTSINETQCEKNYVSISGGNTTQSGTELTDTIESEAWDKMLQWEGPCLLCHPLLLDHLK